jgi:phosphonate transport system substrate-binding protein
MSKLYLLIILSFFLISCNQTPRDVMVIDPAQADVNRQLHVADQDYKSLKVAVSAILSPRETFESYEDIFRYISTEIGMPIEFHQRKTYQEINTMLEDGQLDFAFICSGAYIELDFEKGVELFSAPVSGGDKFYKAYIITHKNFAAEKLEDLENATFAFTDPLSNTGYLYVKHRLSQLDVDYNTFFQSTMFTNGHDISIQMVAKGIVEAASVSHLVYEYLKEKSPERVENVKVIEVSEDFGMPPVVVTSRMDKAMRERIAELFATMHNDRNAREFLDELRIDRFIDAKDEYYNSIRQMRETMNP